MDRTLPAEFTTRRIVPIVGGVVLEVADAEQRTIRGHRDGHFPEMEPALDRGVGALNVFGRFVDRAHAIPELGWEHWKDQRARQHEADEGKGLVLRAKQEPEPYGDAGQEPPARI